MAILAELWYDNVVKQFVRLCRSSVRRIMKEKHMCSVNILHLIEGAKQAKGLTVIIDVFRAFSLRQRIQSSILIGERHGKKCDGFDYGNSPSSILRKDVTGKTIINFLL